MSATRLSSHTALISNSMKTALDFCCRRALMTSAAQPSPMRRLSLASQATAPSAPVSLLHAPALARSYAAPFTLAPQRRPVIARNASSAARTHINGAVPKFNALMKKFNLLVHPDLFMDAPAHSRQNGESLQALNNLIGTLRTRDTNEAYPPRQTLRLVFHLRKRAGDEAWAKFVREHDFDTVVAARAKMEEPKKRGAAAATASAVGSRRGGGRGSHGNRTALTIPARGTGAPIDGEFHLLPVIVATNGGQCKNLVQAQFGNMFYRCGLPYEFEWDEEYWLMGAGRTFRTTADDEDDFADDFGYDEEEEEEATGSRQKGRA